MRSHARVFHGRTPRLADGPDFDPSPLRGLALGLVVVWANAASPFLAAAQVAISARGVGLVTHAAPAVGGKSATEWYLTQPMLSAGAHLLDRRVQLSAVLNLEGLTLRRGELNAGIWGEGYVDRRHPHTYLHELTVTAGAGRFSATAGSGFVPFGTDDPMVRPFIKYPANHHLAQVLERTVLIGAVEAGPLVVEAALFNGDEPTGPGDLPGLSRFGDSWSARTTLRGGGWEAQGSHAFLTSPEIASGVGLDQRKWSASVRYASPEGGPDRPYALLEWARTTDVDDGRDATVYGTLLGEGALFRGPLRLALRLERTERPEEERLRDPFRTQPHVGGHPLGLTRWTIATLGISGRAASRFGFSASPLAEIAYLAATEATTPSFFVPAQFYGSGRMWSFSAGILIEWGPPHVRMGRYGIAREPGTSTRHH